MGRIHLSLCAAVALLVLPAFAWAVGLGGKPVEPSVHAFSLKLGGQALAQGVEPEFGAIGPSDLSATAEDDQDDFYSRFADQIEDIFAAGKAVDPAPDRMGWAILLIAFAGMTAAASGRRRARIATISI
jgi:hypothetical protein